MSTRTLVVLGIVVVALLVAATAPSWWPSSDASSSDAAANDVLDVSGIEPSDVERISVTRPGGVKVVVVRDGDAWKVGAKPADDAKVDAFFDALSDAADADAFAVSRGKAMHEGLGLTTSAGTVVALDLDGDDQRTFVVGNGGDVADSYYARVQDEDRSWQLAGAMLAALPTDAKSWQQQPAPKTTEPDAAASDSA